MKSNHKQEINQYLKKLSKELDITQSEYKTIVDSYTAVGNWLANEDSSLQKFSPKILPQGSFMLGTIIRPINKNDDIDIDLVCKLEKKPFLWTQRNLKTAIGNRLKNHDTYDKMLNKEDYQEGGRRCWTLNYSGVGGYHMDILPSFADENLTMLFESTFSIKEGFNQQEVEGLAIRITDTEKDNYNNDNNIENWHKSNPFGYAKWFFSQAMISQDKLYSLNESVDPVRAFEKEKLPLQIVVQLLKRHRDIMFSSKEYNNENRPISIIITTLAALVYDKSENVIDTYVNIVKKMRNSIIIKGGEKWITNPINSSENFADKWSEVKQKEEYFYLWLDRLEADLDRILKSEGQGLHSLNESLSRMYGKDITTKVFADSAKEATLQRIEGSRKMSENTGILGISGLTIPDHNFEGYNDK